MNLAQQIIHLLLYTGDSMPVKNIGSSLHTSVAEVESVEQEVRESLESLALKLLVQNSEWMISIDKTFAKSLQKQENKETSETTFGKCLANFGSYNLQKWRNQG
jgi:hypothetical protein